MNAAFRNGGGVAGEKLEPSTGSGKGWARRRAQGADARVFGSIVIGLIATLVWTRRRPRTAAPSRVVVDQFVPSGPASQPADAEIEGYFVVAEREVRWSLVGVFGLGTLTAALVWLSATNSPDDPSSNTMPQRFAALRAAFAVEGVSSDVLVAVLGLVALVASLNVAIAAVGRGSDGNSTRDRVQTRVWLRGMGGIAYLLGIFAVGVAVLQIAALAPDKAVPNSLVVLVGMTTAFLAATTTLGSRSRVDEARTRALMRREIENIDRRLQLLGDGEIVRTNGPLSASNFMTRLAKSAGPSCAVGLAFTIPVTAIVMVHGTSLSLRTFVGLLIILVCLILVAAYVHYLTFARWSSRTARFSRPLRWPVITVRSLLIVGSLVLFTLGLLSPSNRGWQFAFATIGVVPAPIWIALARARPTSEASTGISPHGSARWLSAGTWELVIAALRSKQDQLRSELSEAQYRRDGS